MKLDGNTVLITGGATGIGLAIAERFLAAGSQVIVCGRRQEKLDEAKAKHPRLHTMAIDVATADDRVKLFEHVTREHPHVNVLVNNAGIQRRFSLVDGAEDWRAVQQELAINLEAPIHLAMLFLPHLSRQRSPAILNVSSGLSFMPMPIAPVYCATKAALHSFTLSLREQARALAVDVVEIVPPAVQTDLGGTGLHTHGAPLDEFTDAVFERLAKGEAEIGFGTSEQMRLASREELDRRFEFLKTVR